MFDDYLREIKDRLAQPLAMKMVNANPKTISLIGLVSGIFSAVFAFLGFYGVALVMWLANRSLDGLDGLIARLHGKQDDFGGYLDIMLDFTVYAALPIGLVLGAPSPDRYVALIVMLAGFYINTASWMYLAAILEKRASRQPDIKTTITMPSGLIGGFETIVFFSLFIVFQAYITLLFSIFSALVLVTVFQRLYWAKRNLNPSIDIIRGTERENQYISSSIYSEE
ncbi:MAG: CDP-alcohol phosphatidyltransferase family protein [Brevefilum sp.]|nr:CDP-alcohol phosphatidyltransferase family protein [Brevefilum sp.]